ncbi:MAG: nucleotidyltransferase family protein [Parvibaculaceae bacterium]|nr:nucleotidyltransferase family protein [Parvibaculaceae bacterium]
MYKALVLAAGMGSRIRPVAGDLPKPLVPFGGEPILAHNLRWLVASGVTEVWINLHFQAEMISSLVGDGSGFGLHVRYTFEPELLGTAGALGNLGDIFNDRMFVIYGDSILRMDLDALLEKHADADADVTISLFDRDVHAHTGIAGGRVEIAPDGRVTGFVEGALPPGGGGRDLVNAGVYVCEPNIKALIPPARLVDFGRDVFPAMLARRDPLFAHVIEPDGYCLGLDTPESFAAGEALLASGRIRFS